MTLWLWSASAAAQTANMTLERVSLFFSDGVSAEEIRQVPAQAQAPLKNGLTLINAEKSSFGASGVQWKWLLRNSTLSPLDDVRITGFVDIDQDAADNTFFNESVLAPTLTAPAGHIAADRWEAGEMGYWTGSLLSRAAVGDLLNSTQAPAAGEDMAIALSAIPGQLAPGQELSVWLVVGDQDNAGATQNDLASLRKHFAQFYLFKGAAPDNRAQVDYAVTQTVASTQYKVGELVQYRLVVSNAGLAAGSGVTLSSMVPASLADVQWVCSAQGLAACDASPGMGHQLRVDAQVPAGAGNQVMVTVTGKATADGVLTHRASVAPTNADTVDTNAANNDSLVQVSVSTAGAAQADLAVFKTTSTPNVLPGGKLAFQLVAVNHGPAAVSAARLQDLMPSGVEDMRWTCSARGGAVCGTASGQGGDIQVLAEMPVGASITIDVTGAMAQAGGHLVNTASVASELPDPVLSNNSASASVNAPAGALKSIPTMGWLALSLLSGCTLLLGARWLQRKGGLGSRRSWMLALLLVLGLGAGGDSHAIFVNGDFESQTVTGWTKRFGLNPGLTGAPPFQVGDVRFNGGGVEKVSVVDGRFDPRAPQLVLPRQGNFSAKVNDDDNGAHINEISQKGVIAETDRDPGDGKLHVRFSYAAVLEDPSHNPTNQPYFFVEIKDLTKGETLYYDFAFANQPGRVFYTTVYKGSKWLSTPFIDVDLEVADSSLGNELQIRVVGADCSQGGHGGYVYVDAFGSVSIPPQGACVNDLQLRAKPSNVQLTWADTGAASYAVYRADKLEGPFVRLGTTQSRHSTWLDRTVQAQKTYYYSIRALDADGHALCSSGEVATYVPAHWSVGDPVNRPPIFTSQPVLAGDVRQLYEYQATAIDADGDPLSYQLMYAPVGMTVDAATGKISWQPGLMGDFRVNLQVSDGKGLLASQAFSIHVVDGNLPPQITSQFPAKVPAGVSFSHQVTATDPERGPLQYTLGSQAAGISINASGGIYWTNPEPGTYPLVIQVTDQFGARDVQRVVVSVQAFPAFTSLPVLTATVAQPYTYQALASDRDGDAIVYSVLSGPAGLVINASSGAVTWPSPVAGTAAVVLAATDPDGNQGKQSFSIRTTATPNRAPVFIATPVTYVAYPATYGYTASASDADGDNLVWKLLQAPAGMTISERTGAIAWKFASNVAGKFAVRVQVDDQRGGQTEQAFEIQLPVYGNGAPAITSRPPSQVRAGAIYSYSVSATDPEGETLSYRLASGPAAAAWAGNQLSWATSVADVGVHALLIEVADTAGNVAQQNWQLEVLPASGNQPPVISSTPKVTAVAGGVYEYQVVATDRDGDPLSYQLLTGPAGMTISATGKLEWPVPAGFAGSETVEIKVSDGRDGEVTQAYAIGVGVTANRPPLINSTPVATGTAGAAYLYQILASDPDADVLTYSVSTSEPGITVDAQTGRVSWAVPAGTSGQAQLTVQVTDGKGGTASQTYAIGVGQPGNRPPRVTTQPGTSAVSGASYTYALKAVDADGDTLVYALTEFPQGMLIDSSTGAIQWSVPANVAGLAPVMVEVTDGKGGIATQGYAISVSGASNRAPAFSSTPVTSATAGSAYAYTARATDPDGDAISYTLVSAPAGMAIHATSGAISWTPTLAQGGTHAVAVRATDAKGAYATQSFGVYVQLPTNNPPQISSKPALRWAPGVPYQYQVTATDPENDPLTYALDKAPAGMAISASGLLTWNSPVLGSHAVEIKVQDSRGAYVVQSYTLQIAANREPVITSAPVPTAAIAAPYAYQVVATDPDGDFLTYRMSGAPASLTMSATGLISGTPTSQGTHAIIVTVSDGQASVTQSWTLRVTEPAAGGPLEAGVTPSPKYLNLGESTTLQVFAQGGTAPYTVSSLTVNGRAVTVNAAYQAIFTPTAMGKHNLRLTLRDAKGSSVTVDDWFGVKDPSDVLAPLAAITAPGSSDDITVTDVFEPTAIMGTASDANLAEYLLMISPAGQNQWSKIGGGSASVTAAKLGDLNPQTLANGLYDLGLVVRDISGNETSAKVTVAISGEQKTAPLQLTFTDMAFEIEGLPLTVRRSYDSLKRAQRMDFGYGWSVDYQDVWLQTNGVLGRSWVMQETGSGFNRKICVRPQGSRVASVRMPDGRLEQFDLRASPECVSVLQWASNPSVSLAFSAKASNKSGSKLEALGYSDLRLAGGDLFDMGTTETFNPSQYKLTTLDGIEYILNKDFGIQQIKDRNGNSLQFTRSGISHSGGWALAFTRDAQGKISKISGPGGQVLNYGYDAADNLISVVDQSNAASDFRYENPKVAHGLTSYTDPLGRLALKTTYDDAGRVLSQTDAAGKAVTVSTDNTANKQTIKDRNGNTTVYDFDDRGNITRVLDAAGGTTQYAYDANDNEIEVIDALGRKTTRSYDAFGNVTSETDPAGRVTKTAFNAQGNVTTITDAAGNVTTNGYNASGDLTAITDAAGKAFGMGYSPTGSLSSMTDKVGNATRYTYAKINGTTLKQTETAPDGTVTTYAYDSAGNVISTTRAIVTQPGQPATTVVEKSSYDTKGNVTSRTNAVGDTSTYLYDAAGQLVQETDSQGRKTAHEYSLRGEKSKTTYPDGRVESWAYDNNGNETQSCIGSLCTRTAYDALDRATKVTDPMGFVVESVYDAAGQLASSKDARGNSTAFEYDLAGRETKQTNAAGIEVTREYDLAGNLVKTTDGLGRATVHVYNNTQKRTSTTLANGAVTQFAYDANGVLLSETNPLGHAYQFGHDPLGALKTVTDPLGKATGYTWNGSNQLLTQTDANGHSTRYGYDSAGRRVARTLPGGKSEGLVYDSEGRLVSRTDFDGSQTIYSYDVGGKLSKVTRSDGRSLSQGYDSFGRMNSQTDTAYGNLGLTLDGNDRVTREVWSHSSLGTSFSATLDYAWDANSNRTQVSTSGQTIKAGYNTLNQLETLTHPDGSTTRFAYDNAGNRVQVTRADGSTTDYQYNLANQLTAVLHKKADGADIASFVYTLNAAGQRTQVAERMVGVGSPAETVERTVRYQYDAAGKLLQERVAQTAPAVFDSTIDYVYDAVGNRSRRSVSHNGQVTTYQYDSHDRLTQSVDSLSGTTTYQWDERGNLVQKASPADTTTYAWTVDNRLAKVSTGAKTVEYGYDSSGRRIKRLVKEGATTTETHYKVDHQRSYSEILVESTKVNSGAWVDTVHVHTPDGLGELIASTSAGAQTQLFSDGLGSVRVAQTAATSHVFSYDAFGIALGATEGMPANAADAAATSHRYTGEYADSQTGLLHLRARDYDPQLGRFISMDEHPGASRIPLTLNKYLYGNADPVNTVDPSGNIFISMAMPNFGHLMRVTSAGTRALGILDKLDHALTLLQLVHAYQQVWSVFQGPEWQNSMKDAKNQKGFVNAMENFDVAVAELAGKSAAIFANKGVAKAMGEFIRGTRNALLIYGPTPEIPGKVSPFPVKQVKVGTLSLSKSHRDIYVEFGVRSQQGGRMLGAGHRWSREGNLQWFRQDWHSAVGHNSQSLCFPIAGGSYHYHCAK